MGFFAAELHDILGKYAPAAPWEVLHQLGVHPEQIKRIQGAVDNVAQVAMLPYSLLHELRQVLALSPFDYSRLQAGIEADAFFRLMIYHKYSLEEAVTKSNAVFASALKDRLATGGRSESIYPTIQITRPIYKAPPPVKRRKRKPPTPKQETDE